MYSQNFECFLKCFRFLNTKKEKKNFKKREQLTNKRKKNNAP